MFDFPRWKVFLTFFIIIVAIFVLIKDISNFELQKGLKLGLDLQGGTYLVLQADEDVYVQDYTKSLSDSVISILQSNNINYFDFSLDRLKVYFNISNTQDYNKLKLDILKYDEYLDVSLKNNQVIVEISSKSYNNQLNNIISNSIEIIRNRIDQIGTNEPTIKKQGVNKILVELPGIEDPDRIKRLLGTTARLTFHMVDAESSFNNKPLKIGYKFLKMVDSDSSIAIKIEPSIYGKSLTNAKLEFQDNKPVVFFSFNTEGGKKFSELTTNNVGGLLAIVVDNKIISAPRINTPITGGSGIISGGFTLNEAQELAILLKSGSLPIPLSIIEEKTVGPTLGSDSIHDGLLAGIYGYIFVFLFMIIFYKKLGIFANVALIFNIILMLAMLSILGATLTLPGIAGIILTIGMAVDSNILVYERFNQEALNAKSSNYSLSMTNAFKRVFLTIFDSNITTLFVALFLFYFGAGPIRGFAITLIIGILSSIFSIMFITKSLVVMFFFSKHKKIRKA